MRALITTREILSGVQFAALPLHKAKELKILLSDKSISIPLHPLTTPPIILPQSTRHDLLEEQAEEAEQDISFIPSIPRYHVCLIVLNAIRLCSSRIYKMLLCLCLQFYTSLGVLWPVPYLTFEGYLPDQLGPLSKVISNIIS